jgi:hypothetical protein
VNEKELLIHIYESDIFKKWHWYKWHFEQLLRGRGKLFAQSIVRACLDCECHIPGIAKGMIDELAAISGRENDRRHYEQLLQRLAELLVIRQVVNHPWTFSPQFQWEPTAAGSKKNPELLVVSKNFSIGIEVKAPGLLDHQEKRTKNPTQLLSRVISKEELANLPNAEEGITLPRDNPVKDFLISAEAKFAPFRQADSKFCSVLVIVWDDHINEPITALLHPHAGLLSSNSFWKDSDGRPVKFPSVDAVILVRHLHQLQNAAAGC